MLAPTLLDRVLAPGGLATVFQPILAVDAAAPRLFGCECLSRGPAGSSLAAPDLLFDYVRRKRSEDLVDRAVLRQCLAQTPLLPAGLRLSVNLHASTLGRDQGFVDFLLAELERWRLPARRLTLELVEHSAVLDGAGFLRSVAALRRAGVGLALDDLGLGYSNFRMILDVHPDLLKLDRYLVAGCEGDPARRAVLESICLLAERLGTTRIVAEGVETAAELAAVRSLGIDLVQGYYFCPPVPLEDLATSVAPFVDDPRSVAPTLRLVEGEV